MHDSFKLVLFRQLDYVHTLQFNLLKHLIKIYGGLLFIDKLIDLICSFAKPA